jgi:hypothetical protein
MATSKALGEAYDNETSLPTTSPMFIGHHYVCFLLLLFHVQLSITLTKNDINIKISSMTTILL